MAYFIDIPRYDDERGSLCVLESLLPFAIKRLYYIFSVNGERGGHRHKTTVQALICLSGSCEIFVNNGSKSGVYLLDEPQKCLIVEPEDWHTMSAFSDKATLLVMASEPYDRSDYIDEKY